MSTDAAYPLADLHRGDIHFSAATPNFFALEVRAKTPPTLCGTPTAELFKHAGARWRGIQVPDARGSASKSTKSWLDKGQLQFWRRPI